MWDARFLSSCSRGLALIDLWDFGQRGERDMSCTGDGRYLDLVTGTGRLPVGAPSPSRRRCRIQAQMVAVAVAAATLAACGGPAVVSQKSEWGTAGNRHPAPAKTAKHILSATKSAAKTPPYGVASFYKDDTETASGEKFDPHQLTAAHRTLPFIGALPADQHRAPLPPSRSAAQTFVSHRIDRRRVRRPSPSGDDRSRRTRGHGHTCGPVAGFSALACDRNELRVKRQIVMAARSRPVGTKRLLPKT